MSRWMVRCEVKHLSMFVWPISSYGWWFRSDFFFLHELYVEGEEVGNEWVQSLRDCLGLLHLGPQAAPSSRRLFREHRFCLPLWLWTYRDQQYQDESRHGDGQGE